MAASCTLTPLRPVYNAPGPYPLPNRTSPHTTELTSRLPPPITSAPSVRAWTHQPPPRYSHHRKPVREDPQPRLSAPPRLERAKEKRAPSSLSIMATAAEPTPIAAATSPYSTFTTAVAHSPHHIDPEMRALATDLMILIRLLGADLTPWEVADMLTEADSIIHADVRDRAWNIDVLSVGSAFAKRAVSAPDGSPERKAAALEARDFFRIVWETYERKPAKAKLLVKALSGGWWRKGQSLIDIVARIADEENKSGGWFGRKKRK